MTGAISTFAFLLVASSLYSQELVVKEFEKGYLKDGQKYSIWDYYNHKRELELKINHTTGKVYYLKPDSSDFVIFANGDWRRQQLRIYPTPIEGNRNFFQSIMMKISYPAEARRMGKEGTAIVMFEIDTLGVTTNYQIIRDIGGGCAQQILGVLKHVEIPWVPAQLNGRTYASRFILSVTYILGDGPLEGVRPEIPLARELSIIMTGLGLSRQMPSLDPKASEVQRNERKINLSQIHFEEKAFYSLEEALTSDEIVKRLSLAGHNLGVVSPELGELNDMVFLDLERNQLKELPAALSMLTNLEELYMPMNHLATIGNEITSLKKLKILSLGQNQFSVFPKELCACSNLEVLDLGYNKISEIPPCIADLKKLQVIALRDNMLTKLPPEFLNMKRLNTIYIQNNPFDAETINQLNSAFKKARIFIYR